MLDQVLNFSCYLHVLGADMWKILLLESGLLHSYEPKLTDTGLTFYIRKVKSSLLVDKPLYI